MKNTILTLLMLTLAFSTFAQNPERAERIKALKVAFITEKLSLTETEAQKFWPIYNKFEDANNKIRRDNRAERSEYDFTAISDADADKLLNTMMNTEREKYELRKQLMDDLKKVLPSKKLIRLHWTEDQFNRKLFEEMRRRRGIDPNDKSDGAKQGNDRN